jgi:hypothetical protein
MQIKGLNDVERLVPAILKAYVRGLKDFLEYAYTMDGISPYPNAIEFVPVFSKMFFVSRQLEEIGLPSNTYSLSNDVIEIPTPEGTYAMYLSEPEKGIMLVKTEDVPLISLGNLSIGRRKKKTYEKVADLG